MRYFADAADTADTADAEDATDAADAAVAADAADTADASVKMSFWFCLKMTEQSFSSFLKLVNFI